MLVKPTLDTSDDILWINTPFPCFIGFTASTVAWNTLMDKLGADLPMVRDQASASTRALDHKNGDLCIMVTTWPINKRKNSWEAHAAMIAHECVHVVQFIKERYSSNIPLGDETEAYLVQYMVQEILQFAYKTGRSIRREP